jgi:hypothetical protein
LIDRFWSSDEQHQHRPRPGFRRQRVKEPKSYPDGPNVEASPWALDAARGKLPKPDTAH